MGEGCFLAHFQVESFLNNGSDRNMACFHGQYVAYIEDLLHRHQLNEYHPRRLDNQHQHYTGLPSASLSNLGFPGDHRPKTLKLSQ